MKSLIEIESDSPFLKILNFRPYCCGGIERKAEQFIPDSAESPTKEIEAPWGGTLTAESGDYIVSDMENPDDSWVVKKSIFDTTYSKTRHNTYVKSASVYLVPLTDITGRPDELVIVHTLEGPMTVRSGDFYLARGIENEIWPIPKDKVETEFIPLDEADE
ncbi:MAG TPA: hypothetical protein DEH22_15140 [Chloroflexi bacterium]|nr:hypothetical protein [Chloroflexota bacterium]